MSTYILLFLIPIILLTITPGVDTVLVIRNTSRGGWKDGTLTSLGICSGLFFHALISAVGISVIILQSAIAFSLLKIAGAVYLFWLGAISLKDAAKGGKNFNNGFAPVSQNSFKANRSFREGILCNILNPKAIVFYMAFLPQFIDPSKPAVFQTFYLAGIHFIIAIIWQGFLISIVDRAKPILQKKAVNKTLNTITGTIMMIFGAGLLFDN